MRKLGLLFLLPFTLLTAVYGQSTEYSIHLNSGLFSFSGYSQARAFVEDAPSPPGNYIDNPCSKQETLSYGIAAQIQRLNKDNVIMGIRFGYQRLRSHVKINAIISDYDNVISPALGEATLEMGLIDLFPNIGYRILKHALKIDLAIGPDIGFNISHKENSKVKMKTFTGSCCELITNYKTHDPGTDIGIRSSLTLYYGKWGVSAGFSYGLHNYRKISRRAYGKHFSRFIRLGLVYKVML